MLYDVQENAAFSYNAYRTRTENNDELMVFGRCGIALLNIILLVR